jgi:hypothetical protein
VVLERKGKTGWTDHVRNKEIMSRVKRMANFFGHILRRSCRLRHVFEGKIKLRIEVTEDDEEEDIRILSEG